MRRTIRESMFLLAFATALGFSYTAFSGRGFFDAGPGNRGAHKRERASEAMMITVERARRMFDSGAVFVDSRHAFDYRAGHIRDARNLPLNEFDQRLSVLSDLSRETSLVVYCDGAECNSSIEVAGRLYDAGYRNAKIFFGGWQEWKAHGFPTDSLSK